MGSVLEDPKTGKKVWGTMGRGLGQMLALPIDGVTLLMNRDDLVPSGLLGSFSVIPGVVEVEVYERMRRIASNAGGFEPDKTSFSLSYDWRRDLVEGAKQLADLIADIKSRPGNENAKFTLICHSAGGLIARYYVKYGGVDVLDSDPLPQPTYCGACDIDKIIMLGTPNRGALEAFWRLHRGLWVPAIGRIRPETAFTMPSLYQCMPFDSETLFIDRDGNALNIDLYDPDMWERYGWSLFDRRIQKKMKRKLFRDVASDDTTVYETLRDEQRYFLTLALKRAKKFQQALWQGDIEQERSMVTYILLGADCQPTLRKVIVTGSGRKTRTLFKPPHKRMNSRMYGYGDKSVLKDSLLGIASYRTAEDANNNVGLPAAYAVFFCEEHTGMTKSPMYMDNVLYALFKNGTD
jgi:pimeloyl-ACP methyl ester carboxylesterase